MEREVRFDPPWDCKLGQMQQVVRALQRHTNNLLDNRNSVIIRCFPYKSPTYMHMVYNLIYDTLHTNQQYGPALQEAPTEIRPILLHYDDNGMPNPVQHPPALYSTIPQLNPQPDWTDIVLVRVRFDQQNPAVSFLANFNRNVARVFDRTKVRCPFAHPDLTQPERILRHRLQQICMEKNGRYNRRPVNRFRLNFQYQQPEQTNERYFHNGLQIYKQHSNGWTEPVQFENYTELQCLHVVVASMRKYASMYRQKQTSVIIQNVELEELNEADMERITALVYSVVNTDIYRQRCRAIKERSNKFRNNAQNTASNITTTSDGGGGSLSAGGNQRRSGGGSASSNEFLPAKIERIPRRKKPETAAEGGGGGRTTSSAQRSPKKKEDDGRNGIGKRGSRGSEEGEDNGNGKKEGGGNDQEKKKKDEEDQAMTTTAETTGGMSETATAVVLERPPLVRIQFCNKESATAFCQLFKLTQQHQKKIEEEKRAAEEEHGGGGHSTADSYSDLSDLEEVFGSENEDDSDDEEEEGEGQNSDEKTSNDDKDEDEEGKKAAKKKNGKKQRRHHHHQAKMCLYFPNAFAHRDLTPPELALGYALRQYCREKNAEVEGVASSMNVASGSTSADGQQPAWKQRRFFTRIGRIYERKGTAE